MSSFNLCSDFAASPVPNARECSRMCVRTSAQRHDHPSNNDLVLDHLGPKVLFV